MYAPKLTEMWFGWRSGLD